MAAGEYVSVSSQADTERADVEMERRELAQQPEAEHRELAEIGRCQQSLRAPRRRRWLRSRYGPAQ